MSTFECNRTHKSHVLFVLGLAQITCKQKHWCYPEAAPCKSATWKRNHPEENLCFQLSYKASIWCILRERKRYWSATLVSNNAIEEIWRYSIKGRFARRNITLPSHPTFKFFHNTLFQSIQNIKISMLNHLWHKERLRDDRPLSFPVFSRHVHKRILLTEPHCPRATGKQYIPEENP